MSDRTAHLVCARNVQEDIDQGLEFEALCGVLWTPTQAWAVDDPTPERVVPCSDCQTASEDPARVLAYKIRWDFA